MSITKGTPASSQIVNLERMVEEQDTEITLLREYLELVSGHLDEATAFAHQCQDGWRKCQEQNDRDAARYRWLRDRMTVFFERPMSGGEKRASLMMRIGHGYLDSKKSPTDGWTDLKYFDECREKVDMAIDSARATHQDIT